MSEKLTSPHTKNPNNGNIADVPQWVPMPGKPLESNQESDAQAETDPPMPSESDVTAQEIAEQPDVEIRYHDAEILGKNYPVRRVVKELGNQRLELIETVSASWKNTLDTPGKYARRLAHSLANSLHARRQRRFDAVAHLPDGNILKNRRAVKLERTKSWLDRAKTAYDNKSNQMKDRRTSIPRNAAERRSSYINELAARRESALARREVRRNLRAEGAGMLESLSITRSIPKEHLERVGKLAGQAHLSHKDLQSTDKNHQQEMNKAARLADKISKYTTDINNHNSNVLSAESKISKIKNVSIPDAKDKIESLQDTLGGLSEDDPERTDVQALIDEQENLIRVLTEREIPYWERAIEHSRNEMSTLDDKRDKATKDRLIYRNTADSIAETANEHIQTSELFDSRLDGSIKELLNNEGNK